MDDIFKGLYQSESDFEGVASYLFFPFPIISPSAIKTSPLVTLLLAFTKHPVRYFWRAGGSGQYKSKKKKKKGRKGTCE